MQNGPQPPSLKANSSQQIPQPTLGARPSTKAAEYMKNQARRARLQNISQICILIIGAITYGFTIAVVCFALSYLFMTPFGKMLGDLISSVFFGYSHAFLPEFLAAFAPWMMLGIPLLVVGAQLAYAIATQTHGFSLQASSWVKTLINAIVGYSLPFVVYTLGLMFGVPLVPLLWATWGLGILSGFYITIGHQLINQIFADPNQQQRQMPIPPVQGPTQEEQRQQPANTYLPSRKQGQRSRSAPPPPLSSPENAQEEPRVNFWPS